MYYFAKRFGDLGFFLKRESLFHGRSPSVPPSVSPVEPVPLDRARRDCHWHFERLRKYGVGRRDQLNAVQARNTDDLLDRTVRRSLRAGAGRSLSLDDAAGPADRGRRVRGADDPQPPHPRGTAAPA